MNPLNSIHQAPITPGSADVSQASSSTSRPLCRKGSRSTFCQTSRILFASLLLISFVAPAFCAYIDKDDTNLTSSVEPVLKPGTASVLAPRPGEYPYYGNAPADMLPYRN